MDFVCQEFRKGMARIVLLCPTMSGLGSLKQLGVGTAGATESSLQTWPAMAEGQAHLGLPAGMPTCILTCMAVFR